MSTPAPGQPGSKPDAPDTRTPSPNAPNPSAPNQVAPDPRNEDHNNRRRYGLKHVTTYTYDGEVSKSLSRAMLRPRATGYQQVDTYAISVTPNPAVIDEHVDAFGNFSHYVEVDEPHSLLEVTKTAEMTIHWPKADLAALNEWTLAQVPGALANAPACDAVDPFEVAAFSLPSTNVTLGAEERAFAQSLLRADMPLGEAIETVYRRIYEDFEYSSGSTTVSTTLPQVLAQKAGVCQDFAHLAVMAFRAFGIPARYVSGYIETYPPAGKEKLEGADASHAWAAVLAPTGEWIDLDPTNNQPADSRYLVNAWGRDFRDVSPLKGIIFADDASSKLKVGVTVKRLPDEG